MTKGSGPLAFLLLAWTLEISGGVFGDDVERRWVITRRAWWQATPHQRLKALPKTTGEKVVDDGVNGRAEVKEHSWDYVHIFEYVMHVVRPTRDEAPQESVDVEWSPADGEH